ncbi:MAG: hypothetical protein QM497_05500 [Sulfurimonas sp.]
MSKFFQAFLTGIFFTFILDFFIFLGIKLNYIDFYNIDLYYNILFADHQNIYLYTIFSILIGYVVIYTDNNKTSTILLAALFAIVSLSLIKPIGHSLGELMLMTKNITLQDSRHTYIGDKYYDGRKKITFYDYELKKVILLDKKRLINDNNTKGYK